MSRYVLMGVSGCGKTTVGTAVADILGIHFVDGDALHPASNVQKMASGQPLNDEDRAPWLSDVGRTLAKAIGPTIIGCSTLKQKYHDLIRSQMDGPICFLHLHASQDVLVQRVNSRDGHFMPPALLDNQFATLEMLEADEKGRAFDIARPFDAVVADIQDFILSGRQSVS